MPGKLGFPSVHPYLTLPIPTQNSLLLKNYQYQAWKAVEFPEFLSLCVDKQKMAGCPVHGLVTSQGEEYLITETLLVWRSRHGWAVSLSPHNTSTGLCTGARDAAHIKGKHHFAPVLCSAVLPVFYAETEDLSFSCMTFQEPLPAAILLSPLALCSSVSGSLKSRELRL